ncbi:MAG: hypothetical protein ACRCTY_02970 [Candidatus Adiutrix sp.]
MPKNMIFCLLAAFVAGIFGSFIGSWLLSAMPAAADSSKALIAGEFRLADESGRTRLLLTLVRGKPRLFMLDDSGEYRLEMGLGESGEPHLWLRDQDGAAKIQVALTAKGRPAFRLADHKNRERVILGLSDEGAPTMILRDDLGRDRLAIWSDKNESGLALADKNSQAKAAFTLKENQNARLSFFDSLGQAYSLVE